MDGMPEPDKHRMTNVLVERAKNILEQAGYDIMRRSFYSPIPEIPGADAPIWREPDELAGIHFDVREQMLWADTHCSEYMTEYTTLKNRDSVTWNDFNHNGYYESGDADLLYAMVRHCKPARIVEVGAGFSSWVTALACEQNEREGFSVTYLSVDPESRTSMPDSLRAPDRQFSSPVQDMDLEVFQDLQANDILFIDSSHSVKLGSDVNHLILKVMPHLRSGVLVHFHDIFFPWHYPRHWFLRGTFLAEQYLLQGYLSGNRAYEVVLGLHAMSRQCDQDFLRLVPEFEPSDHGPSACWLRRT